MTKQQDCEQLVANEAWGHSPVGSHLANCPVDHAKLCHKIENGLLCGKPEDDAAHLRTNASQKHTRSNYTQGHNFQKKA